MDKQYTQAKARLIRENSGEQVVFSGKVNGGYIMVTEPNWIATEKEHEECYGITYYVPLDGDARVASRIGDAALITEAYSNVIESKYTDFSKESVTIEPPSSGWSITSLATGKSAVQAGGES